MRRKAFTAFAMIVAGGVSTAWLMGCGKADFTSGGSSAEQAPAPGGYTSLTWWWPCEDASVKNPLPAPTPANDKEVVLVGAGPHALPMSKLMGTPVHYKGQFCLPTVKRDIVFVVDVSGSMNDSDHLVGGTCGRLNSIKAVAKAIGESNEVRYSLVTFSDKIYASSSGFFGSVDEMLTDVLKSTSEMDISKVVCADKDGTDYTVAMKAAGTVLGGARGDAVKELYFISDGNPDSDSVSGVAEAKSLKDSGVTIAGLMLTGDPKLTDKYLESPISSLDPNGAPLYAKVSNASELIQALVKLSANDIEKGQFKYRGIGVTEWKVVDMMEHRSDNQTYELPSFVLAKDTAPKGLETLYEYYDRHGSHFTSQGKLNWKTGE